ncbi:MAG: MarR family winged helix-turn-helix transcriptional regulator [Candidatus Bathyarchaeia archaeon]
MTLNSLEKRGALQILLHLHRKGKATRTDLRGHVDASMDTIYTALKVLMELGLVEEMAMDRFPFSVQVTLTEKGRRVAEHIAEVDKILAGRIIHELRG